MLLLRGARAWSLRLFALPFGSPCIITKSEEARSVDCKQGAAIEVDGGRSTVFCLVFFVATIRHMMEALAAIGAHLDRGLQSHRTGLFSLFQTLGLQGSFCAMR